MFVHLQIHTVIPQILRWAHPLDCGGHPEFSMYTKAFNAEVDPEFSPPLHQRPIDMAFVGECPPFPREKFPGY